MHVMCKFVVIVVWNNFAGIKFHFYHWRPSCGEFFFLFFLSIMGRLYTNFVAYYR
jgi:hypothetical protein